jgi:hypothetical protein
MFSWNFSVISARDCFQGFKNPDTKTKRRKKQNDAGRINSLKFPSITENADFINIYAIWQDFRLDKIMLLPYNLSI